MERTTLEELDQFFSQYPLKQYPKGQMLIYADEDPSGIFYLVSGKVRKYDVNNRGDEVVLNTFQPSVFFPMTWILNKTPNRYFFEATTPIVTRYAPASEVERYLATHPAVVYSLLKQVYSGLEDTQRRVVHLMKSDTRCRLLFELLIESRRSGELQQDGSCVISISMNELSQRAGLSRERISRELSKLIQQDGLLTRRGRSLVIRSIQEIEDELDGKS
jgi:CRP-like cAMP-binding protein